jgi:ubiquitin-activating enzyme E1
METRRVAGRIVPAMITTTGLVSALSCLELVKLLKGVPLSIHRNAFVNLALPFFAFTAPLPAEEVMGANGETHTIWDSIVIKGSSKTPAELLTLSKFIEKLKKKADCEDDVEISSISFGPYMIYANFLHSHDEELLETSVLDIVRDAVIAGDDEDEDDFGFDDEEMGTEQTKKVVELTIEQKAALSKLDHRRFIDFSVAVENVETGEEFELPVVRLERQKKDILTDEDQQ